MTRRISPYLIAGIGLIAVATAAAATLNHGRVRPTQAACDTSYDLGSTPLGEPVSVAIVTCKRPAATTVSSTL